MLCFHHNDADGRSAAAIVAKYIKENFPSTKRRFVEVDYDIQDSLQEEIDSIEPNEVVYIVDFHFKPEIMELICARTTRVFVYDHHKTTPEVSKNYPPNVVCILEPGSKYSGCELVWNSLYPAQEMPAAIKLIGDRDAWKWVYGDNTASFNEGLKLYEHGPENDIWDALLNSNSTIQAADTATIIDQGHTCLTYRDNLCKDQLEQYGYEVEFEGYKCFVVNFIFPGCGAEMFGDRINEYDMCISSVFNGEMWKFSLRSDGRVDVAEIARKYGGGGHAKASGFYSETLPFTKGSK